MTGPEHYREAENALAAAEYQYQRWGSTTDRDNLRASQWELRRAQVHATLAHTAATALEFATLGTLPEDDCKGWLAAVAAS